MGRTRNDSWAVMHTQIEGLIFAVLVIPVAIGWLLWQRHMKRFEVRDSDVS